MYFLVTKVLLQPMPMILLILGAAIANLWRKPRQSRRRLLLATIPFVVLVLMSLPVVIYPLLRILEWPFPPIASRPEDAEAIVVLGGGISEPDAIRRRPVLTEDSLYRCLHAAELYHHGKPCLMIVTGGALDPESGLPAVAPTMRETLVMLGVRPSDVIVEPTARTTYENAVETRKILRERGIRKVVLVTEAVHMSRSLRCFRKQGIVAVPAACSHRSTGFPWEASTFLPSPGAIKDLMAVLHEWLGIGWYWFRGKI